MTSYTAHELIAHGRAYLRADAERMARRPDGAPRGAWRDENPIATPMAFEAIDTAYKTRPVRWLRFDCNGHASDLWVWSETGVVERIDLNATDADARLARYERV